MTTPHPHDVAQLRLRSRTLDAAVIGRRVKNARLRLGLTQTQAAGAEMSTAYISRIEAGQRRAGFDLLTVLASRLGVDLGDLVGEEEEAQDRSDLLTRYSYELSGVELSLGMGEADQALGHVLRLLEQPSLPPDLEQQARYLHGLALEATGRLRDAIRVHEDLVEAAPVGLVMIRTLTALARCYREEGNHVRARNVGERARILLDEEELTGTVEGVKLAVTVAAAFHERGDTHHALRMCERAIAHAELLDDDEAQAAACWNTSMMHAERGDMAAAQSLAQRAVLLFDQVDDKRNMARLRGQLGQLQLQQDPPELDGALLNLDLAHTAMLHANANVVDRVRVRLDMAEARLLMDAPDEARELAEACLGDVEGISPLLAAEARIMLGRCASRRDLDAAVVQLRAAVLELSAAGDDRRVAQLWYELGELLHAHGDVETAVEAFRNAGASTGLRPGLPSAGVIDGHAVG